MVTSLTIIFYEDAPSKKIVDAFKVAFLHRLPIPDNIEQVVKLTQTEAYFDKYQNCVWGYE